MPLYCVFDVESVGLHGEGFAVGAVVVDANGDELDKLYAACDPKEAAGHENDRLWLSEHLPPLVYNALTTTLVRQMFWEFWVAAREQGAILCADVPWPVEARFLIECVDDEPWWQQEPDQREAPPRSETAPYPIIDVASVRLAAGYDPLATEPRLDNELPIHDPLADARQSARLLIEALTTCGEALSSLEVMHG